MVVVGTRDYWIIIVLDILLRVSLFTLLHWQRGLTEAVP